MARTSDVVADTPNGDRGADKADKVERGHRGPGVLLRNARERRGLSQRDAAEALNLSCRFVVAMENEQFDKLPAAAFARGYLRNYARLLAVPTEEVLNRYQAVVGDDSDPYLSERNHAQRHAVATWFRDRPIVVVAGLGTVAATVVLVIGSWLASATDSPLASRATLPVAQEKPVAAAAMPVVAAEETPTVPSATAGDASASSAVSQTSGARDAKASAPLPALVSVLNEIPAAAEPASATGPQQVGDGPDRLQFSFHGDCWVEVRDATGTRLYSNNRNAGSELVVGGTAPFKVVLGNAAAARVQFNGSTVNLGNQSRSSVASLTIGG